MDKQQLAKDLYLQADKSQTEIAEILDVNRKTVYLWSKKGKWEEKRIALSQTPSSIQQDYYNHMSAINAKIREREDNCPTMEEVEKLRKLTKMTKDLGKKNAGFYMEVLEEFSYFIQKGDRDFLEKYGSIADQFLNATFGDEHFYTSQRVKANYAKMRENIKNQEVAAKELEDELTGEPEELVFDGFRFVPVKKSPSGDAAQTAGCQPKTEGLGNNGASALSAKNPSKPATVEASTGITNKTKCPISSAKISDKNGASPTENKTEPATLSNSITATIPPLRDTSLSFGEGRGEVRPAPFREGNIIWINHPKDLDDYEKHLKMSDIIRYYPESDPALRNNNRVKHKNL